MNIHTLRSEDDGCRIVGCVHESIGRYTGTWRNCGPVKGVGVTGVIKVAWGVPTKRESIEVLSNIIDVGGSLAGKSGNFTPAFSIDPLFCFLKVYLEPANLSCQET